MNAATQSAFRLSDPKTSRQPVPGHSGLTSGRHHGRYINQIVKQRCARIFSASGLRGARILLCGASDRRYSVSATSPFQLCWDTKKDSTSQVTSSLSGRHLPQTADVTCADNMRWADWRRRTNRARRTKRLGILVRVE